MVSTRRWRVCLFTSPRCRVSMRRVRTGREVQRRHSSIGDWKTLSKTAGRFRLNAESPIPFDGWAVGSGFVRSSPMRKKQYRAPKVGVGTVKKSIAAMASRRFLRNVSQRFPRSGFQGWRSRRDTVGSDTLNLSIGSLPCMRGCRGFLVADAIDQFSNLPAYRRASTYSLSSRGPFPVQPETGLRLCDYRSRRQGYCHPD
jgi:hypothetical protein